MPSYEHKKLVEHINMIDNVPRDPAEFSKWISARQHLAFLERNAESGEIVIYGSGEYTFIHSIVVPNRNLTPPDKTDLLKWSSNPFTSIASYVCGGGREGMWIERGVHNSGSVALDAGRDLVFGRTFEGWRGEGRTYFEVNQEYTHLSGIHWRPEHSAYCKYDVNGDLEYTASITSRENSKEKVNLASFGWEALEEYLAASDSSLVRMFDFTLMRRGFFNGWSQAPETMHTVSPDFFFRQKIEGNAAYTRGVQIVRVRRPATDIMKDVQDGWIGQKNKHYAMFTAHDFRNAKIALISTDPSATTNYFEAEGNSLPFELSPAFFRPEVLSKYKTDREKYTVGERSIDCRAAWHLRGYDVNDAGQVHAYICDLRALPFSEQLHWLSFNEPPKAKISERALVNDFKGEFVDFQPPLQKILSVLKRWRESGVDWWTLRDEHVLTSVSAPVSTSRDEWSEAFMDLSKLIAEGFETKAIRSRLDAAGIPYEGEASIALLEKLLGRHHAGGVARLPALRTIQRIRSQVKGHAGSSEAKQIVREAIAEYGSLAEHFNYVCNLAARELESIERDIEFQ